MYPSVKWTKDKINIKGFSQGIWGLMHVKALYNMEKQGNVHYYFSEKIRMNTVK